MTLIIFVIETKFRLLNRSLIIAIEKIMCTKKIKLKNKLKKKFKSKSKSLKKMKTFGNMILKISCKLKV